MPRAASVSREADVSASNFSAPKGRRPKGYGIWDAADEVWRNTEGEAAPSKQQRSAQACRVWRERKRQEKAEQQAASRLVVSAPETDAS